LKPLDIEFMKRLHEKVNIIPLIAKADTLTPEECQQFKKQDRLPLAVVGSNTVIEVSGKRVRGRQYPWGVAEVENSEHCDFTILRNMLIRSPLAQMEEERREHVTKMKKMEMEMEQVFDMKVKEKIQKLKDSEAELQRRHEQMKKNLEAQHKELEEKRRQYEDEKVNWEAQQRILEQQKLDSSR
ncbi:UNVERIFIED_CONTAM: hypothetical protein FKN15_020578, partial [Acipenser sinensis]